MGLETVLAAAPVSIYLCPERALHDEAAALEKTAPGKTVARVVRGFKSTTKADFMTEIGAALQFPHLFGENWDALVDAASDLTWGGSDANVVVVSRALVLLDKEPAAELKTFVEVMRAVAERMADRRSAKRTFRCVLHATKETEPQLLARLERARISLNPKKK
jgi:hypothetical protein